MKYPTHLYATSIVPPKFEECDCPVAYVGYVHNHTVYVCKFDHLFRGYIRKSDEAAKQYAERAAKKLHVEARQY